MGLANSIYYSCIVSLEYYYRRNTMAACFVTWKGVIIFLAPVPRFSFYAFVFCKNEEGNDKMCLLVEIICQVQLITTFAALKNLNSLSKGTKEINSKRRWLVIFTEYGFIH